MPMTDGNAMLEARLAERRLVAVHLLHRWLCSWLCHWLCCWLYTWLCSWLVELLWTSWLCS